MSTVDAKPCDNHPDRVATDLGEASNLCQECVDADVNRILGNIRAYNGPEIDL